MSKQEWAALVYGRSYHLDFRFITIPHNFTEQDIQWASPYIFATTQQARNLADSPRWSLFKNDSYCIMGVTCMVRDLIGRLGEDLIEVMAKDDQGRPLYVFVGYVTKLNQQQNINDFPPYTENCLDNFKLLYQEIAKIWLVKNYEPDSRQPLLSQYQPRSFSPLPIASQQILQLNDITKYPDQTYLYPSLNSSNQLLWNTSVQCSQPTSTCLNIKGKSLNNSPFLNQTLSKLPEFQIRERMVTKGKDNVPSAPENSAHQTHYSLSQRIPHRAKEDLDLTIKQATKVATASQELINNFTDWSNHYESNSEPETNSPAQEQPENFGFKTKKSSAKQQDWF